MTFIIFFLSFLLFISKFRGHLFNTLSRNLIFLIGLKCKPPSFFCFSDFSIFENVWWWFGVSSFLNSILHFIISFTCYSGLNEQRVVNDVC